MATVSEPKSVYNQPPAESLSELHHGRRVSTSHLKRVPETKLLRTELRGKCQQIAIRLDRAVPLKRDQMEQIARSLLDDMGLPEGFVGWSMVMLASEFWRDQVAATDPARRLFLVPDCPKHAEGCPAKGDESGLGRERCGACGIAYFGHQAERMGYRVLVAEGSPSLLKFIVSGHVDAIIGIACLNVLEKAIDKILLAGIPCVAVPLLSNDSREPSFDKDWIQEMIQLCQTSPAAQTTRTYLHLMREASRMFEPVELRRLIPRSHASPNLNQRDGLKSVDPIAATEAIAYDFLSKGGKHSRPFITLAVYDALTGALATRANGADHLASVSDSVKRAAMAIETFHKASLVHDDIEDDDSFRYGELTLHRRFGIPTAINVGDYLIGLGYRLVSRERKSLGAETAADVLDLLADAHLRLSEGQGAELAWRDSLDKSLQPIDALKIYALKTAPAFEAALLTGLRLADESDSLFPQLKQFSKNLGVAFQILNDLKDWAGDHDNKMMAAADVLGGRPTLLWALALEALTPDRRQELESLVATRTQLTSAQIARVRELYCEADVFEKARNLVDKHQARAESIADEVEPEELRRLFHYLIETVLERSQLPRAVTPCSSHR